MSTEPLTDHSRLMRMLMHARPRHDYQRLAVDTTDRSIIIDTGPDDAAAVFVFDAAGRLQTVSVVEAHPEMELDP